MSWINAHCGDSNMIVTARLRSSRPPGTATPTCLYWSISLRSSWRIWMTAARSASRPTASEMAIGRTATLSRSSGGADVLLLACSASSASIDCAWCDSLSKATMRQSKSSGRTRIGTRPSKMCWHTARKCTIPERVFANIRKWPGCNQVAELIGSVYTASANACSVSTNRGASSASTASRTVWKRAA